RSGLSMSFASKFFRSYGAPVVNAYNGETITGYVAGDRSNSVSIEGALVELSYELGTNEMPGDGPVPFGNSGERERRTGHLGIPRATVASLSINEEWSFWIDGELWFIQRRDGKDNEGGAYIDYRITNVKPQKTR